MKSSLALVAVGALLLSGVAIGVLGAHLMDGAEIHLLRHLKGHASHDVHQTLTEVLDLTPGQEERIDAIIEASQAEARALHEEMLPKVEAHVERVHGQIRELLTAEQRQTFDQMHAGYRARLERDILLFSGQEHARP